ncbi:MULTISPECIES: glycoside hydrolase family 5 protein [unclassified Modestobacter]|uniref:glycoside hydrolase family 5 protein n=1 Tax=unclassified Modestobacter TaxID=2643866 RepID=UPI0022AAE935|nr:MULTISPECIES: cellulase family glycosylhydrolase [unclassified Modestobacter]MCZ2825568.1 cellulase family glycosylhydrolase [Modestobacter sp. VKM Ac-2981]MCZ2853367.1 cellulase family glycosylhydrolase [Modestobacter sp. VKM Ac-2982]
MDYAFRRGVNAAGGEFNDSPSALPGRQNTHYAYNQRRMYSYLSAHNHEIVRIPFRWERIQHSFGQPLDPIGLMELQETVEAATSEGLSVILDMHNYGTFVRTEDDVEVTLGSGISIAAFADAWRRLVHAFENQPGIVGWGLMNEPHDLKELGPGGTWQVFSQKAVDAIRAAGDTRDIYVSGDQWGGAQSWQHKNGAPWITDPAGSIVYEAHYYLSENNAGAYPNDFSTVESEAMARGWTDLHDRVTDELSDFTDWASAHNVRGFIGEIGWPHDATDADRWNVLGDALYSMLDDAGIGATYWATGTRWNPAYRLQPYSYDPTDGSFTPNAQATVIEAHPSRPAS